MRTLTIEFNSYVPRNPLVIPNVFEVEDYSKKELVIRTEEKVYKISLNQVLFIKEEK